MTDITINEELLEIFYEETKSLLDEMKQDIPLLSQGARAMGSITSSDDLSALSDNAATDQTSVLKRLFRCAHIIKSSSRSVGLDGLEQISGALERITKKAGDGDIVMSGDTISLLSESVEACQELLNDNEVAGHEELTDRLGGILQSCGK
jgi:chemotaxis protein histidine kinase CheA